MIETKTRPDKNAGALREAAAGPEASERGTSERARASDYLDLWERHVGEAGVHGKGIFAPWFGR